MLKRHTMPLHNCRPVPLQRCYGVGSPLRSSGVKVGRFTTLIAAASQASSAAPKRRRLRRRSPSASVTSSQPATVTKKPSTGTKKSSDPSHPKDENALNWCTSSVHAERCSEKGQIVKSLFGRFRISCLSACPTDALLAVGASKGRVMLLNLSTGERMHVDHACDGNVQELKWSPDGQKLAITCFSGTVTVWDRETRSGTCMPGMSVTWAADNNHLITTFKGEDSCIMWNVSTGATVQRLPYRTSFFWAPIEVYPECGFPTLASAPNGRVLAFFPEPSVRVLWDPDELRLPLFSKYDLYLYGEGLDEEYKEFCWAWSCDASKIAVEEETSVIRVCSIEPDESLDFPITFASAILLGYGKLLFVAWRPAGHMLAMVSARNRLVLWDYSTNTVQHCMDFTSTISSVGWSACGKQLLVASKGCVHIFDVDVWAQKSMFRPIKSSYY